MLTLSLRPGEYVDIGDNIRFVFTGGTTNSIHVMVEAPKDLKIERSEAPPEMRKPLKRRRKKSQDNSPGDLETRIERIFEGV